MRMRLTYLMLLFFSVYLSGCEYFAALPYPGGAGGGRYWSKKGLGDEEVRQFYWQCFPRRAEMYKIDGDALTVELEIKGQTCMLKHGFNFNDTPRPHGKLCSKEHAKMLGLESYMVFPACQAKYGKYRK